MILKRPYAFFIKIFKPLHIIMSVLLIFLIYNTNKILSFLANYISSDINIIGEKIYLELISNFLYIIPTLIILFCLLFLGIMFRKEKPIKFYVFIVFCCIIILVINIYSSNIINIMDENIISIKTVKLNHDLILINILLETICFVLFFVRGIGLNYKNLDFDSDILKLDISDYDKEEIEVNIKLNIDDKIRKKNKLIRNIKYLYKENKFIVNFITIIFICAVSIIACLFLIFDDKGKKEGVVYNVGDFNIKINNTYILNDDFNGNKISENQLVVVEMDLQSDLERYSLNLNNFSLRIGNAVFNVNNKYANKLLDLGKVYSGNNLQKEYLNYIIIFEIPEKYIKSDMVLSYSNKGYLTKIDLKPKKYELLKIKESKKIGETINFDKSLGDIKFTIDNFQIKDKFLIEYNYCIQKNDCIKSKEYLKASIDQNFDKHIMLLKIKYFNNSKYDFDSFYDLLSNFGAIYYKIDNKWYSQRFAFEKISSKKVKSLNKEYIGINSAISHAKSIKIVFTIRGSEYEYILK